MNTGYGPIMGGTLLLFTAAFPAGMAAADEHEVRMAGADYSPSRLVARLGDSIRFINDDDLDHAVFVPTLDFAVDLGTQKPGETRRLPLGAPGRFEVECVFHSHMLLTVTVIE